MPARSIHSLPNLGPRTAARLVQVGVETEDDLAGLGAVAAYRRLKHAFPREVSLNALWALHAGLLGVPWTALDAETKARLKAEALTPPSGAARPVPARR